MAEEKSLGKFLIYCILVLVWFLMLIPVVFSFGGKLLRAEVLILLFLMFLSLLGFAGFRRDWGERVLFFVFLIGLGNLVFIWYFTNKLFMVLLFLGLMGFLMSLPKRFEDWGFEEEGSGEEEGEEVHSEVFEEEGSVVDEEESALKSMAKKSEIKASHSPGKYVASKMGSVYHEPKCEWAKKIVHARRIWFKDKREASGKGYKKHKCVA